MHCGLTLLAVVPGPAEWERSPEANQYVLIDQLHVQEHSYIAGAEVLKLLVWVQVEKHAPS